ncbi:MAG: LysR family transcriptional regulator [Alphaproteobacteria bacterium]|nr:LysR family transcriptional regulator [Alphaproteobacteria bacterium]
MDHLTALRVFRAVVDCGTFAGAARDLGLSNAAVSKNVGELESHLGTRLLNRTTRAMSLTEAGARFHARVSRLLEDLADAEAEASDLADAPRGRLRVSAPMSWGLVRLAPMLPEFLALHPHVALDVAYTDAKVDVVGGGFDVVIRGEGSLTDSSFIARKLCELDRIVCASPDYVATHGRPRHPETLSEHECLIYSLAASPETWHFTRNGKSLSIKVAGRYRANSSLAIGDAATAGTGIALIPRDYVRTPLKEGRLVQLLKPWRPERQGLHAIYPSSRHVPARLRAFVDFLVAKLPGSRQQ